MTINSIMNLRTSRLALSAALLTFAQAAFAIDPIKVGVTIAQSPSGSIARDQPVRDGLEIALKMINDAGGALGRPFELVYEDAGSPEKAGAAHPPDSSLISLSS